MITKSRLAKRPGWSAKRIQRDLGDPDEIQRPPGRIVKLYSLERVEAAEASGPAPSTQHQSHERMRAKGSTKRRSRKTGMTPDREDALVDSMLAQAKDGISDDELMETTWSAAALRRRGWTDTLIRDILGEPHWLAPNPKYPNAGAPMKLWDRCRAEQLERTNVWQERRSRRNAPSHPTPAVGPMDNLAIVDGWHSADGEIWHLLGAPMFPRALASARGGDCWLMIMPHQRASDAPLGRRGIRRDDRATLTECPDTVPAVAQPPTCEACGEAMSMCDAEAVHVRKINIEFSCGCSSRD